MILREQRNAETAEGQSNISAVIKQALILVPSQGIDIIIYLWVLQALWPPCPSGGWNDVSLPDLNQLKLGLLDVCPSSMLTSFLLKPRHEYAHTLNTCPILLFRERLLWEGSPVFSLLAVSNNKSFLLPIFGLVDLLSQHPPWTSFQVTLPSSPR